MISNLNNITWANAYLVIPMIIIVFFVVVMLYKRLFWQKKIAYILDRQQTALRFFSFKRKKLKALFFILGFIALLLAILRPQQQKATENLDQEGRDVLIALDVSRSMLAQDAKPSRLEKAKQKIKKLISLLGSERVGLIIFSGDALLQCPLTDDLEAFKSFLNTTDVETISSGATALHKAIDKALAVFDRMPGKKHKLLLIVTDGEDFSEQLTTYKERLKAAELRVFSLGVGTPEGAPIMLRDQQGNIQGHQKDAQGNIVISRLNEPLLRKLAQESGALYMRLAEDDSDISQLVKHINAFDKEKLGQKSVAIMQERYYYFALPALFFLLLEWLL